MRKKINKIKLKIENCERKTFVFQCLLIFNVSALSHEKFNSCGGCLACEHHDHDHDQHDQHDIGQVVVEELALADYVLVNRSCDQSVIANKFVIIVIVLTMEGDVYRQICFRSIATIKLAFSRTIGYYFLRTYFPLIIIVFW